MINNVSNCINLIKLSIKNNKKGFIIYKNNKNLNVLKAFIKINIINYIQIKKNYIIVFINYVNEKPVYNNIVNVFRPSNKMFITIKEIKKINIKHNWIFLISTNRGIINNNEALKLNVGGLLLVKIWN